jgi:hypothetical protein
VAHRRRQDAAHTAEHGILREIDVAIMVRTNRDGKTAYTLTLITPSFLILQDGEVMGLSIAAASKVFGFASA